MVCDIVYEILEKVKLNDNVSKMVISAPLIARKAAAGQFLIIRIDKLGERIPLTIADYDSENDTVTIIYQKVGKTTMRLDNKEVGDSLLDVVGPLGKASELGSYKKAIVVGGGVGCAISYPQAKELYKNGCKVEFIAGFRNESLIILQDEIQKVSNTLDVVTDDGSNGRKGLVTDILKNKLELNNDYDLVVTVGPLPMMKAVCDLTKKYNIKTIVSMNPIMIDGTGMCGGCRVTVGGKVRFACVDGPDFDGHDVDFEEIIKRNNMHKSQEIADREHYCRLMRGVNYV